MPSSDAAFTSEVTASPASSFVKRTVIYEQAGRAFHALQRRASGLTWEREDPKLAAAAKASKRAQHVQKKKEQQLASEDFFLKDRKNYYALLGIEHIGLNASDKEIKRAYQQTILVTHPDKISQDATPEQIAEANLLFRDVQVAYEVLSDEEKRRGYDSQFDFDDSIPSGHETMRDEDYFYNLYGPVFERNARFSTTKPVPLLGEPEDDEATVKAMYNFWMRFKSWRDFSAYDEFKDGDLETAEGRDHRRHMQGKNEKQREKRRKEEYVRVQKLVERAQKNDPRLAQFKKDAAEAKEKLQAERDRYKNAAANAKKAEEEAAALAKAEAEAADKAGRDAAKKAKLDLKKKMKKALNAVEAELALVTPLLDELTLQRGLVTLGAVSSPTVLSDLVKAIAEAKSFQPFVALCADVEKA